MSVKLITKFLFRSMDLLIIATHNERISLSKEEVTSFAYDNREESAEAFLSLQDRADAEEFGPHGIGVTRLATETGDSYFIVVVGKSDALEKAREFIAPKGEEMAVPEAIADAYLKLRSDLATQAREDKSKRIVKRYYGEDSKYIVKKDGSVTLDENDPDIITLD